MTTILSNISWAVCKWSMQAAVVAYAVMVLVTIKLQELFRLTETISYDHLFPTYLALSEIQDLVGELVSILVVVFIVSGVARLVFMIFTKRREEVNHSH